MDRQCSHVYITTYMCAVHTCVCVLQAPVTIPPKPVKTSKNFQWKTADDNHYYMSICLIIASVFYLNPLGVCCACIGFYFARKVHGTYV